VNVKLAVLADYAATTQDGKLIICGVFEKLQLPTLPFQYPRIYVALRVSAHPSERKKHTLAIRIVDPDGASIFPDLRADLELGPAVKNETRTLQLVLDLAGLKFETAGGHSVDILLDDRYEDSAPFAVEIAPQPGTK